MNYSVLCGKENKIGTLSTDFVSDTPGGVSLRDLIDSSKTDIYEKYRGSKKLSRCFIDITGH